MTAQISSPADAAARATCLACRYERTCPGETTSRSTTATAGPYLTGGLAALSGAAAAIHFAVVFEHFSAYVLYGVFFLVISWAQAIWAAVVLWRPSRPWLWLGIAGNAIVLAVYLASRTTGLPFGPDKGHTEPFGALDVVTAVLEFTLITGCAVLLSRPALAGRLPVCRCPHPAQPRTPNWALPSSEPAGCV